MLHNFHAIVLHEEILCREFYDDLLVAKDHIAERLRLVDSPLRPKALSLRTTASTAPADLVRHDLETPLDEALGLVDGYTPGVAALIGRCAAEHPFGRAEAAFRAYTGLEVDARQFPRLAALLGPAADAFLRGGPASGEVAPPRAYVAADGTGVFDGLNWRGASGLSRCHAGVFLPPSRPTWFSKTSGMNQPKDESTM